MNVVAAIVGIAIAAAVLWEVFNDLFQPAGSGTLSSWVARHLFQMFRRVPSSLPLAGPFALVTVIGIWVFALVIAFGLIYVGPFPDEFRTSTGQTPPASPEFLSAVYFSYSTLTTLGYGDLVPQTMRMRWVATTEGLVGFGLLTASITSMVMLYQGLSRMRLLARGVAHVTMAERRSGLRVAGSGSDVILGPLARDVTRTRTDLVHFPILYYFSVNDPDASVARWTRELARLAAEGSAIDNPPHVRLAAASLDDALNDLAALLEDRFVGAKGENRDAVFRAFAADHCVRMA